MSGNSTMSLLGDRTRQLADEVNELVAIVLEESPESDKLALRLSGVIALSLKYMLTPGEARELTKWVLTL